MQNKSRTGKAGQMRWRTWVGRTTLFALGLALGLALAGSSHGGAGSRPDPSSSDASGAVAAAPTPAAPSPTPPTTTDAKLSAIVGPGGNAGGKVVIPVPPPEPELCSPVHIAVHVGQTTVVACRSANYDGPITLSVADQAIASVFTSNNRMLPRYVVITGRDAGTTILRVSYPGGPTRLYPITVYPA